ncbi:DUF1405 domain-containing protein [Pontibacillus salicampi]|uniref:DUF1405 domain-containing protein n=1 Tax=Pontibacillus salicampi TaxID=1449801 RepID=A0ABV6LL91_9BACI
MHLYTYILKNRSFLTLLLIINTIGTIYGYWWYKYQLAETPLIFIPFVPDSPTASLFFCIVIAFFLFKRNIPYVEALAIVTLWKYGVWAVLMNILLFVETGYLPWTGYMLIVSHGAMAIQGLLYAPFYKIKIRHLVVAGIWTFHNDVIDYVFEMMPTYGPLNMYMNEIGYGTFWLTVMSLILAYFLTVKHRLVKSYEL